MKAIFISFNQAYYEQIVSMMDRNNLRGFTYWNEVQGRGSRTGEPHNSAMLVMVDDEKVDHFLSLLHQLDQATEAQGLRAFVWNIEQTI